VRKGNGQHEIIGRRQKDTSVETGHQVRNEKREVKFIEFKLIQHDVISYNLEVWRIHKEGGKEHREGEVLNNVRFPLVIYIFIYNIYISTISVLSARLLNQYSW